MTKNNASQHLGHCQNLDKFNGPTYQDNIYGTKSVKKVARDFPLSYPDNHAQNYCRQYMGKDKNKQVIKIYHCGGFFTLRIGFPLSITVVAEN